MAVLKVKKPKRYACLQREKACIVLTFTKQECSMHGQSFVLFLSSHDSIEGFLEVSSNGGSAVDSGDRCFFLLRPNGFHRV